MQSLEEEFAEYLQSIRTLTFGPLTRTAWLSVQDEGLDEEFEKEEPSDWKMAKLLLSDADSLSLKEMSEDAIEKFNRFDILLKEFFGGNLVDLVDYDKGTVHLVCPSDYDLEVRFLMRYSQRNQGIT